MLNTGVVMMLLSLLLLNEAKSAQLIFKGARISRSKFVPGRVLILPSRALAKQLTAGTAFNTSGAFNSKWAAEFYSHPKVADVITALKKKNDLEDISTLHANGSPTVLFAGFRLFRQRQSNPGRLTRLLKALENSGFLAEPDFVLDLSGNIPNDPLYGSNQSANMNLIHAPDAWSYQTGSLNVNVCIIDSGMICSNNDVTSNCRNLTVPGHGTGSVAVMDDKGIYKMSSSYEGLYANGYSHGTMVASVLAASGNNGKGTSGVAWRASLFACAPSSASDSSPATTMSSSFVAACAKFCHDNGAHIVQISLTLVNTPFSQMMYEVFSELDSSNTILMTVAAGNQGVKLEDYEYPNFKNIGNIPSQPAAYNGILNNMIVVGNVDPNGVLTGQSNFGPGVNILAPGVQCALAYNANGQSQYMTVVGTSFAAPVVAGAAALLLSSYHSMPLHCVTQIMKATATASPAVNGNNSGILNINAMFMAVKKNEVTWDCLQEVEFDPL